MLPTSASFLVTEDCNLACKYCFEKHNNKTMTKETAEKALEFLAENAVKEKQQDFHAMIFGGEPLLNIQLIDDIFHKGEALAKEKGLTFTSSIITNGTIMNDEIYEVLKWHKKNSHLTIQLSVDGNKETHDEYRVTKSGKGSFDLVAKNISKFKKLFERDPHKLCIHGCLNKKSVSKLYENYKFFREELGFVNVWFLPVAEEQWSEEDVSIYDFQNEKIYNDIASELMATNDTSTLYCYAPMDRCLNKRWSDKPCGAGDSFVTVTAEGDIYPCHQIYFNNPSHDMKIGDIFNGLDEDKRKIYTEYTRLDIDCDKNCENNNCYRCIAANYCHNGDLFKQIKGNYCKLMSVDKKYQNKLYELAHSLRLIDISRNETCNSECLCNSREGNTVNGCDVVHHQENCESGNNPDNPNCLCDSRSSVQVSRYSENNQRTSNEFEETMTLAMQVILEKLENIEKKLEKKE